jgi:alpha-tubulin suppressor-like RCC1 family protein
VDVACGGSHTVAVTSTGRAFAFGSSPNGQLGLGTSVPRADTPTLISSLSSHRIVQVNRKSLLLKNYKNNKYFIPYS